MNLLHEVQHAFRAALKDVVADPEPCMALVRPTQDAKHGDYQANCAMPLAKQLGKPPREIAQQIADRVPLGDMLQKPKIAGPGFINVQLRDEWIAARIQAMARSERLGVERQQPARTIVIDFSSPNVAKPLHVGHLRSTIIGDALARLLRFLGHKVITDNHLGDWGTQFGMLLYGYKHFRDEAALKADPVAELLRLYKHVRKLMDDEEEGTNPVAVAVRQETAKLHAGDAENVRLWQMFMPWGMDEIERIYRRMDIHFDHTHGESFYNPQLSGVVSELQSRGLAVVSEGAVVVFVAEDRPPAIIRKSDGAFTYTTSDLATIRYRVETWKPDEILYVVDFRQGSHFQPLFEIARRWGYDRVKLEHVAFGTVLGPDRKPFKTREGGVETLASLLDEGVAEAARCYEKSRQERIAASREVPELTEQEQAAIAEVVGIGAIKYADLSQNRSSDYVFSWDKMLAMEGNTATYMQYAYARIRSIFRKGGEDSARFRVEPPLPQAFAPAERALAIQLLRLEEALLGAAADYRPNGITSYLWDVSKGLSTFYAACDVLSAETPALRDSRLLLCDLTGRVIQLGLGLLGIRTVEQM